LGGSNRGPSQYVEGQDDVLFVSVIAQLEGVALFPDYRRQFEVGRYLTYLQCWHECLPRKKTLLPDLKPPILDAGQQLNKASMVNGKEWKVQSGK
jgi:hypothetical protein